jgi:hypothetical protein
MFRSQEPLSIEPIEDVTFVSVSAAYRKERLLAALIIQ